MRHTRNHRPPQSSASAQLPASATDLAKKTSAPTKVQLAAIVYRETMRPDGRVLLAQDTNKQNSARQTQASKQGCKLSRLFSKKKSTTPMLAGERTLIDNAQGQSGSSDSAPSEQAQEVSSAQLAHQQQIGCAKQACERASDRAESISSAQNKQPVIEFKFDLIVDRDEQVASRRLKPNRLEQSVDGLVESFVLHSNDVCIISTGKKSTNEYHYNAPSPATGSEFEYLLNELGAHILAYSFDLIAGQPARLLGDPAGEFSLELGATLLLANKVHSATGAADCNTDGAQFNIVNLLHPLEQDRPFDGGKPASDTVDCKSLDHALASLRTASERLASFTSSEAASKLLLVSLKLKQPLNGGLFTNRMCIIDFDAKFYELEPIIESIFNGQALAHLKKRKHHLESLDAADSDDLIVGAGKHHTSTSNRLLEFERDLLRAECLLYRQLSSALMRTMVIVHVRKLSMSSEQQINELDRLKLEQQIMADNLELLEFARSIQRASAMRLRRRKRHLRSHLASSNLSVASNASLDTTSTSFNQQLLSSASTRKLRRHQPAHLIDLAFTLDAPADRKRHMHASQRLDAISMHSRRHRHGHSGARQRANCAHHAQRRELPLRSSRQGSSRHRNRSDLTESSSMSTSTSGSQTTTRRADSSGTTLRRESSSYLSTANGPSDSDSITSAFLNSCSSSSAYNQLNRSSERDSHCAQHGAAMRGQQRALAGSACARFIAQSDRQSSSPTCTPIELCSMSPSRRRSSSRNVSVIQIDSYPLDSAKLPLAGSIGFDSGGLQSISAAHSVQLEDNLSDTCSVVAEPPKQLKLEEFLSKLNSVIGPISSGQLREAKEQNNLSRPINCLLGGDADALVAAALAPDGFVNLDQADSKAVGAKSDHEQQQEEEEEEEEEDCKSHSSILEHLSSLALESNNKLNTRAMDKTKSSCQGQLVSPVRFVGGGKSDLSLERGAKTTGHLQTLLNNSNLLRKANSPRVVTVAPLKQQLQEDINCRPSRAVLAQTSKLVSIESSCSSSSSSLSCNSTAAHHLTGTQSAAAKPSSNLILSGSGASMADQKDLYAVVMRSHQDRVRT